jgi:hypothetical protein
VRNVSEVAEIRLQTSTLMASKGLLMQVPWRNTIHDEWDLLLRASVIEGVGLAFAPEPLVIWHSDAGLARLSIATLGWRGSAAWFRSMHSVVGPRIYASFLLSTISIWARNEGDWQAFFALPLEAIRLTDDIALAHTCGEVAVAASNQEVAESDDQIIGADAQVQADCALGLKASSEPAFRTICALPFPAAFDLFNSIDRRPPTQQRKGLGQSDTVG